MAVMIWDPRLCTVILFASGALIFGCIRYHSLSSSLQRDFYFYFASKEDIDQESIQLSTTPDPRHHMEKL